jgi:hypothetical protein
MRSSNSWLLLLGAGLTGVVGLLILAAALVGDQPATGPVLTGLVLLAVAVGLGIFARPPRGGGRAELAEVADGPAVRLPLRPNLPLANLFVLGALTALVGYGMLAIGLGDGGLLLLPVLLLVALPLPDTVRALLRRPDVTLTTRAVAMRGWGADARLEWEDVAGVEVVVSHPRRPVLRVLGRPAASSWEFSPRRIVLPLDARPDGPHIDVRLQALAAPGALEVVVEELAGMPQDRRAAFLRELAPRLLAEDLSRSGRANARRE